jgi:PAT family beta-lactamase induction signal transducer AmpG
MLITQIFLLIGISVMAFLDPSLSPLSMALAALCVSFFSASQDIVIDAYRTEFLEKDEYGTASGVSLLGYRMAMITSGAVALILADHLPWQNVYLLMAACMSVGILASFIAPEPKLSVGAPKSLRDAVVLPFVEFFKKRGFGPGLEILLFIIIYKMDVAFALALTTPFMMELGFSKTDIGAVSKAFGLAASIFGTLAGGAFMLRYGIKKSLWIFGIIQGVSGLTFALLARMGHHYPTMVAAITIENVCSGLATAAFLGFIMNVCDKRFTATQFALFSSLTAITRTLIGAPSGHIALAVGWEWYFIISVLIAIPGLLLLTRYNRWIVD